jgi:hypothetical protein
MKSGPRICELYTPIRRCFEFSDNPDIGDLEFAIENAKKMGNHFTRTHHVMTNPIVELNEDNATVRANLIATHVYRGDKPGVHYEVGWCTILCRSERLRGGGSPT